VFYERKISSQAALQEQRNKDRLPAPSCEANIVRKDKRTQIELKFKIPFKIQNILPPKAERRQNSLRSLIIHHLGAQHLFMENLPKKEKVVARDISITRWDELNYSTGKEIDYIEGVLKCDV